MNSKLETRNSKLLVLGYGNPSRKDDRVGWYVVEELQKRIPLETVQMETLHQLEIEWVETISQQDLVIFVDTHVSEIEDWKRVWELQPGFQVGAISHHLSPSDLLGLSKILYHKYPRAYLYSVKGVDFNFGTELTEKTKQAADETVQDIIKAMMNDER